MSLSAWIGWPGSGPAPGHDWLPGPRLRFVILGLTYAFLALALTVNYAYSTAFFLLALLGLYVGFRRGFVNGLTRTEKLAFLAFAAYPAVAMASYLLGTQTNIGFRFLGRDLRFLLFIPVYLAIRWARPNVRHVGWAFAGGAVADLVLSIIQRIMNPHGFPQGFTGTHISFGDLSILSGFLAAALLMPLESRVSQGRIPHRLVHWIGAVAGLLAGVSAGVVAGARGGWLVLPVLLVLFLWMPPLRELTRWPVRLAITIGGPLALALVGMNVSAIRHRVIAAEHDLSAYLAVANERSIGAPCVDRADFLKALLRHSYVQGNGRVEVVRLPIRKRSQLKRYGCDGGYVLSLFNLGGNAKPFHVSLYRGEGSAQVTYQHAAILARGRGRLTLWRHGRASWVLIRDSRRWRRYHVAGSFSETAVASLRVPPGARLWVVPIQHPHGIYAYALAKTSLGQRLEMWRAAWVLFLEHPWLGAGTGAFKSLGERALGDSALAPIAGDYQHAHNAYLTDLGTRGMAGFISLLALLLAPLIGPIRGDRRVVFLPAAVLALAMGIFALTESMFVHSLVISWYAMVSAVLTAAATSNAKSPELPSVVAAGRCWRFIRKIRY